MRQNQEDWLTAFQKLWPKISADCLSPEWTASLQGYPDSNVHYVPSWSANCLPLSVETTRSSSRSHLLPTKTTWALSQEYVLICVHLEERRKTDRTQKRRHSQNTEICKAVTTTPTQRRRYTAQQRVTRNSKWLSYRIVSCMTNSLSLLVDEKCTKQSGDSFANFQSVVNWNFSWSLQTLILINYNHVRVAQQRFCVALGKSSAHEQVYRWDQHHPHAMEGTDKPLNATTDWRTGSQHWWKKDRVWLVLVVARRAKTWKTHEITPVGQSGHSPSYLSCRPGTSRVRSK